ncbi:MAG: hypothetical protein KF779_14560, partial [Hyphomonadaceae bacterium]|nr:hypothetical protein [Hyphomonadaceae bacterium]
QSHSVRTGAGQDLRDVIMRTQGGWRENQTMQIADPTAGARERLAAAVEAILARTDEPPESDPLN